MSAELDLRGKDYLTEEEAAHYCGLSPSAFRAQARLLRIPRGRALTTRRVLFRRSDLQHAIEWHGFASVAKGALATPMLSRLLERKPHGRRR